MLSTRLLLGALLLPIFYFLDQNLHKAYIFDPAKLQQISQNAIAIHGNDTLPMMRQITADLKAEYGSAIVDWTKEDWFFNNAGGAMGTMVILHSSITEYLIFFGTALQTEGHSGVHMADDYFTILVGEEHFAGPGDLTAQVYRAGDQNHLPRGASSRQYSMPGPCFALELAQGWIPAMLPFGFADTFSSTLDFGNLWKTVRLTVKHMGSQALLGKF
ncbi:C-8 sterol isomerase [Rhinocladiella similis]